MQEPGKLKEIPEGRFLPDVQIAGTIIQCALDAIVFIDASSNILSWNPSAEKLFGWKEAEVLGNRLITTIIPAWYRNIHNRSMERFLETRQSVMLNRLLEVPAIDRNGVEFLMELTIIPLHQDGKDIFCGFMRNISRRAAREEKQLRNKELSDSIINSLPGIFYLVDQQGRFRRWNKNFELVSGYSEDEVSELTPLDFFAGKQKDYIAERISIVFKDGFCDAEADFINKQGIAVPYFFTGQLIFYEGANCFIGTGVDISSRKIMEEKLVSAYEKLRQLSSHLQNIREEERAAVAHEMHDELGQQLSALKMSLSWIEGLGMETSDPLQQGVKGSLELLEGIINSVRLISQKLRPSILDDLGLAEALDSHSREFEMISGIAVSLEIPQKLIPIPSAAALGLFRIYQEALLNIARHAHASRVTVTLRNKKGKVELNVKDDGEGFDTSNLKDKKTFGLQGMQERALMIEGTYHLRSKKGKGTQISVSIPV